MSNKVIIHCQPSLYDSVLTNQLNHEWSRQFGNEELDVIVDDVPYTIEDGIYQDPDQQLCTHYGLDYDQVNCIEAM